MTKLKVVLASVFFLIICAPVAIGIQNTNESVSRNTLEATLSGVNYTDLGTIDPGKPMIYDRRSSTNE